MPSPLPAPGLREEASASPSPKDRTPRSFVGSRAEGVSGFRVETGEAVGLETLYAGSGPRGLGGVTVMWRWGNIFQMPEGEWEREK